MAETDLKQESDGRAPVHNITAADNMDEKIVKAADDTKEESYFEGLLSSEAIAQWEQIGRYLTNICVNVINFAITNTCIVYAIASTHNNSVRLHIIFCVLGFQLCMNQGTLILSKYNTWTLNFCDQTKRKFHWYLQAMACVLVCGGSIIIIFDKRANTCTSHSIFGVCAVIAYLLGFFSERLVITLYIIFPNFKSKVYIFLVKFIHYVASIAATLFYCVCLCYGLKTDEFQYWAEEEEIKILLVATCLVTAFVIIELLNNSVGNVAEILEDDFDEEPYEDDDSDIYVTT